MITEKLREISVKNKNRKIMTIVSKTTNSQLPMSNVATLE